MVRGIIARYETSIAALIDAVSEKPTSKSVIVTNIPIPMVTIIHETKDERIKVQARNLLRSGLSKSKSPDNNVLALFF